MTTGNSRGGARFGPRRRLLLIGGGCAVLLVAYTVAVRRNRPATEPPVLSTPPGAEDRVAWEVKLPEAGGGAPGRLRVVFPEPVFEAVDGGVAIRMPGQAGRSEPGSPDLPVFARSLPGVPGLSMSAKVVHATLAVVTQGVDVVAVETRETVAIDPTNAVTRVYRKRLGGIYDAVAYWPPQQVGVTEAWMGTRKLARIVVAPVQYNPVERTLRILREIEVELRFQPSAMPESERGPL